MNLRTMKKYAQAVVELGVNVKEGQYVVINSSIRQSKFVHCLVEECYKRKARFVKVEYSDDEVSKLTYKNVEEKTYIENTKQNLYRLRNYTKILPVQIYVEDSDPDVFKGIDISKAMKARIKTYPKVKKYRDMMENKYQWVIVAMPSKEWAKKVFPNDTPSVAFKKLEDAILKTTRIDNNAVNNWKEHIKELQEKSQILNDLNLDYLEYKSSNGTDLKLKLMPNHQWISARENALGSNIDFTANMPTEEVFSMPSYDGVDGVVVSTKPLSLRGKLVEDFKVYFEKGRAYKVEARVGQEVLEELLSDDEGSRHLGEVALVPYNSPINESGILFFNTLFDENAACHLAFGRAYESCVKDADKYSEEELEKIGVNNSVIHVDFMIGTSDLEITGINKSGETVQIFSNGNWAF